MDAFGIALIALAAMFGSTLLGILVRPLLAEHHRSKHTTSVVKLGVGMVITVTSLVLSLLTFSVKGNFDATEREVRTLAASIIILDRALHAYGPEADGARDLLREYTDRAIRTTWPEEFGGHQQRPLESRALGEKLFVLQNLIRRLDPADAFHREVAGECLTDIQTVVRQRFGLIEQVHRSIPSPLLWGVICWLAIIFLSFGLRAPRNTVVLMTMALCALAIASSIYFVDDMDTPFDGVIKISSTAMRSALAHETP